MIFHTGIILNTEGWYFHADILCPKWVKGMHTKCSMEGVIFSWWNFVSSMSEGMHTKCSMEVVFFSWWYFVSPMGEGNEYQMFYGEGIVPRNTTNHKIYFLIVLWDLTFWCILSKKQKFEKFPISGPSDTKRHFWNYDPHFWPKDYGQHPHCS